MGSSQSKSHGKWLAHPFEKIILAILFPADKNSKIKTVVQCNERLISAIIEKELPEICERTGDDKVPQLDDIHSKTSPGSIRRHF